MSEQIESLFEQVFAGSWWSKQMNFPPCDEWKGEIEKHLRFMRDKGWLAKIKPHLQSRQYDSFLSEIFAAYFIENDLGFEVTRWNPQTTEQGHDVEFCIKDGTCSEIFCEVKSPGWQGQLTQEEMRSGRAKQPKYLVSHDARYVAPYKNIRKTIDKSYKKFLSDRQNLLIITDNLLDPLSIRPQFNSELGREIPWNIYIALYNSDDDLYAGKGCFHTKTYENLGGTLFLNDKFLTKFFAWFEANPDARMPLSKQFVAQALKLNEERIKSAEHDFIKHNGTD